MKRHFTPVMLTLAAFLASGYLTACQKKGNGGTSIGGVQARPAAPAKAATSEAQPQLQNGDKDKAKNLPEQKDPQVVAPTGVTAPSGAQGKVDPNSTECVWGDEPACDDVKATPEDENSGEIAPSGKVVIPRPSENEDEDDYTPSTDEAGTPLPSHKGNIPVKTLAREYTGAAQDGYRNHLMSVMADRMKNSANKTAYYKTAEAITRVKAYLQDGIVQVTINHKESGKEKVTILGGPLNADAGAARLVVMNGSVKRNNDIDSSVFGKTAMTGVAVCADNASGNCHIMVIRLQVGSKKIPVWILHRSTNADISMAERKSFDGSESLKKLYTYFSNVNRQTLDSVKTVIVDSFEIIHGASGMKITALMNDNQVVSARGPLLAPRESILTNVEWKRDLEIQDLYDQEARSGFKSELQNSLSSVHLLTNDGKQEFTLNYGLSGGRADLDVTYLRVHPTVRDILDIRTILNGLRVGSEL